MICQNDFPLMGYCKCDDYDISDNDLKLLIWIITDGTIVRFKNSIKRRIQFHFTRQDKIDNLKNLLDSMHIKYSFYPGKHRKPLLENRKQDYYIIIYGEAARHYDKMLNYKKQYPLYFTKLSQRQLYIFLDEIKKTDGHEVTPLRVSLSTINKHNADIIQQLCIHLSTHNLSRNIRTMDRLFGAK